MEKRYYIAALFALGLAIQPATLHANTADENNGVEMATLSSVLPSECKALPTVVSSVTSTDDIPSKHSPVKCWNSAISDSSA